MATPNDQPNYEDVLDDCMELYANGVVLPEMLDRLCAYTSWVNNGFCFICDQHAEVVPLVHNRIQRILLGAAMFQAGRFKPIRQIDLKARKGGASTLWQTITVFLCQHYDNQVGLMLAHVPDSTREIFQIAKKVVDTFPALSDPFEMWIKFPETDSRYNCHTAAGAIVGAGGTITVLHLSEVALWERNKTKTLTAAMKAVAKDPKTILIMESTARGQEEFYAKFNEARYDPEHPYISVFVPWFLDDTLVIKPPADFTLDADEQIIYRLAFDDYAIELGHDAFQWRRDEIKATIGGIAVFRQEYPSTPEEAVQGSADLIFPGMRQCIVDELPFDPEMLEPNALRGGIDYGYNDPTVILTGAYVDRVWTILEIYRQSQGLAEQHASHCWDGCNYAIDPAELSGKNEMLKCLKRSRNSAKIRSAPRKKTGRLSGFVKGEIELVQRMMVEGRLKILRSAAEQIVLEAENYFWNPKSGEPDDRHTENCGHLDTMAALRYGCMGCEQAQTSEVIIVPPSRGSRREQFRL